jgi:diguanylate cyclase (GGDEF)-like protein/PAS domain S-box-containing protein
MLFIGLRLHKLVFENITFKEKHKKSLEEITHSENKFRTIFEYAPVGIFYYNKDYMIYDCNEEFSKVIEVTKDKLINFNLKNLSDKRIFPLIEDALSGNSGAYEGEYITTASSIKAWISLKCSPIYDENQAITGAIGIVQNRTEMQLIEEKVRHLAYHDNLTGLPNRVLLKDRMGQAISQAARLDSYGAILFLDLDNFKSINDSLGHHIGDKILKQTALRIKSIMRAEDTVSRIGGDEFVVILPKVNTDQQSAVISANHVAGKIHKELSNPFNLIEKTLYTSTSIGIVIFSKEDKNLDDLLKNADIAMYEAKKEGRGCTHFYNEEMNEVMVKMLRMEISLRDALKNNELQLYFQPIFDYRENTLVGAETLLRWLHPTMGLISPADFIPLAEDTNLIIPIGEWIIEEVCKKLSEWNSLYDNPLSYISINVSVNQLRQYNFADVVIKTINKYGIPPDKIVLEITENVLIGNFKAMSHTISALRDQGLHIALDDFGTGYSSLTYLKKLELDIIKIDRAFIQDIVNDKNDTVLVEAILSIAENFQMKVIAEGVEELEQIKHLTKMGCRYFQGYYYSRPIPAEDFENLIK